MDPVDDQGSSKRRRLLTPVEVTLGKWAPNADTQFKALGWEGLDAAARGRSNMTVTVGTVAHRAAPRPLATEGGFHAYLDATLDP